MSGAQYKKILLFFGLVSFSVDVLFKVDLYAAAAAEEALSGEEGEVAGDFEEVIQDDKELEKGSVTAEEVQQQETKLEDDAEQLDESLTREGKSAQVEQVEEKVQEVEQQVKTTEEIVDGGPGSTGMGGEPEPFEPIGKGNKVDDLAFKDVQFEGKISEEEARIEAINKDIEKIKKDPSLTSDERAAQIKEQEENLNASKLKLKNMQADKKEIENQIDAQEKKIGEWRAGRTRLQARIQNEKVQLEKLREARAETFSKLKTSAGIKTDLREGSVVNNLEKEFNFKIKPKKNDEGTGIETETGGEIQFVKNPVTKGVRGYRYNGKKVTIDDDGYVRYKDGKVARTADNQPIKVKYENPEFAYSQHLKAEKDSLIKRKEELESQSSLSEAEADELKGINKQLYSDDGWEKKMEAKLKEFGKAKKTLEDQPELARDPDTGEIDIDATIQNVEDFREKNSTEIAKPDTFDGAGLKKNLQDLDKTEKEISASEKRIELLDKTLNRVRTYSNRWTSRRRWLRSLEWGWEFFLDQILIGFAFMLPGDIIQAIQQAEAAYALYKTVTSDQTFGLVKMHTLPGLIPHQNAANGVFIYWNVPNNGYTDPTTRYFGSYSEYNGQFKSYLGSGQVSQMFELTTGSIFNGSGIVTTALPIFDSLLGNKLNNNSGVNSIQDVVGDESSAAAGDVRNYSFKGFAIAGSFKNVAPSGNTQLADLLRTNQNYHYMPGQKSPYSPIFNNTLAAFNYSGVYLSGFNLHLRQLQGIGQFTEVLVNYSDIIDATQSNLPIDFSTLANNLQKKNMKTAINTAQTNNPKENWNLIQTGSLMDQYLFATAGVLSSQNGSSLNKQGVPPGAQLIAQGVYIYQTDDTQTAQYLRSKVTSKIPLLKDLIHDYVVCLGQESNIVPAQVVQIIGNQNGQTNPVVWVANPNITQVVSLISGITYLPNGLPARITAEGNQQGDFDYSIANTTMSTFSQSFNYDPLLWQIGSMRYFAQTMLTKGPFKLNNGYTAYQVTGLENEYLAKQAVDSLVGSSGQIQKLITQGHYTEQEFNALSNAARSYQPPQVNQVTLSTDAKKALLAAGGGIYIYRIPNGLTGTDTLPTAEQLINSNTKNTTQSNASQQSLTSNGLYALDDYVIPVTVNPTSGNYLIVPLASEAIINSGNALPSPSYSVLALVSIITGKMYDRNYVLLPDAIKTNIVVSSEPGKFYSCCVQESPTCNTVTEDSIPCINGQQIQSGGINVSLNKAFMESALNPLNAGVEKGNMNYVSVWPYYYTYLSYDYIPSTITESNITGNKQMDTYATTPFSLPLNQGNSIQTLSTSLMDILPQKFIQTLYNVHTDWANAMYIKNPWDLHLKEGPTNFTQNNNGDWLLTAESFGIFNGAFLYHVTSPVTSNTIAGVWIAANVQGNMGALKVNGTTIQGGYTLIPSSQIDDFNACAARFGLPSTNAAVAQITRAGISINDFTNIGADVGANPADSNALLNLEDGTILLKVNQSSSPVFQINNVTPSIILIPLVNALNQPIQLNPSDISQKLTGLSSSSQLAGYVNQLQAGNTQEWFGPQSFGSFNFFINRDCANLGYYIYQTFKNGIPSDDVANWDDYFVVWTGAIQGKPYNADTAVMVSLKTGLLYYDLSVNLIMVQQKNQLMNIATSNGTNLSGLKSFANANINKLQLVANNTFSPFIEKLLGQIETDSTDYYEQMIGATPAVNTQSSSSSTSTTSGEQIVPEETYPDQVIETLEANLQNQALIDILAIKKNLQTGQIQQADPSAVIYQGVLSIYENGSRLYGVNDNGVINVSGNATGTNDRYYLQNGVDQDSWYAFNLGQSNSADGITALPTGVYFAQRKGNLEPVQVVAGHGAQAFAQAHGITIDSQGNQSRNMPVLRSAIPMVDQAGQKGELPDTQLAGGKTGQLMVMLKQLSASISQNESTQLGFPVGSQVYLYVNNMHFPEGTDENKLTAEMIQNQLAALNQPQENISPEDKVLNKLFKLINTNNPYGFYLQINPPTGQGDPYYISLITGFEYTLQGLPKMLEARLYYDVSDTLQSSPLTVWETNNGYEMLIPINYGNQNFNPTVFQQFTMDTEKSTPAQNQYVFNVLPGDSANQNLNITQSAVVSAVYTPAQGSNQDSWQISYAGPGGQILGNFQRATNVTPQVWQLIGTQTSAKDAPVMNDTPAYQIAVTLGQGGFCFAGILFTLPENSGQSLQGNYYMGQQIMDSWGNTQSIGAALTVSTSPLLYCNSLSNSALQTCQNRPDSTIGVQLPKYVQYLSIAPTTTEQQNQYFWNVTNQGAALSETRLFYYENQLIFYVFQPVYPTMNTSVLQTYSNWMKMTLVSAIDGSLTLVSYLQNPQVLTGQNFGNPQINDTWGTYTARILKKAQNFYDAKIKNTIQSYTGLSKSLEKNTEEQIKTFRAKNPQSVQTTPSLKNKIDENATLEFKVKQIAYDNAVKFHQDADILQDPKYQQEQISKYKEEEQQTLAALNSLISGVQSNWSQSLYYDQATGYLVYKVQPSDIFINAVAGQYVSYPAVTGSIPGGIVFDALGVPNGSVLSLRDLETMVGYFGGLKGVGTQSLKLAWPKLVNSTGITIPQFSLIQGVVASSGQQNSGSGQQPSTSSNTTNTSSNTGSPDSNS